MLWFCQYFFDPAVGILKHQFRKRDHEFIFNLEAFILNVKCVKNMSGVNIECGFDGVRSLCYSL